MDFNTKKTPREEANKLSTEGLSEVRCICILLAALRIPHCLAQRTTAGP